METCPDCVYSCVHLNSENNFKICWSCFLASHLVAIPYEYKGSKYYVINNSSLENTIDHPGYILLYNYENEKYKLKKLYLVLKDGYDLQHILLNYIKKLGIKKNNLFDYNNNLITKNFDKFFNTTYKINKNSPKLEIIKN